MSEKKVEVVSEAIKSEEKLKSQWFILTLEGDLVTLDEFDFKGHKNLQTFSGYEVEKDRSVTQEPPHVSLMRSLELVDYEPASDPGNMRYYPKGRMVKALLEEFVTGKVLDYGGMAVETPRPPVHHRARRRQVLPQVRRLLRPVPHGPRRYHQLQGPPPQDLRAHPLQLPP
jgi:hypothetical protein